MKVQIALAATVLDLAPGRVRDIKIGHTTISYTFKETESLIDLGSIRTPASKRGAGSARKALQEFLSLTDSAGYDVELLASPLDKKTKIDKLVAFYKSFGFELTGRRNMAFEPYMLRKHK